MSQSEGQPLVSVCIQTYQHAAYIKECLDSVLIQETDFSFEIILGEDDSTDGTRGICIEYANRYPDIIRLFPRAEKDKIFINGEKTGRFNFIGNLKAASGKYIALLDGDDYWLTKHKLQKQVDFLKSDPGYVICFHRVYELEKGKKKLSDLNRSEKEETYTIEDLANRNFIHTPSVVFRNGIIKEFPIWITECPVGDYVLHMLNAKHGKIKYLPELMAVYRKHPGGMWSTQAEGIRSKKWLKVIDLLLTEDFSPAIKEILKTQRSQNIAYYLWILYNHNEEAFIQELKLFTENDPEFSKEWLLVHYPDMLREFRKGRMYKIYNLLKKIAQFVRKK